MLNFNFNYNISDPVKKNNITIFFLQSKTKLENNFLTLEESISTPSSSVIVKLTFKCIGNFSSKLESTLKLELVFFLI